MTHFCEYFSYTISLISYTGTSLILVHLPNPYSHLNLSKKFYPLLCSLTEKDLLSSPCVFLKIPLNPSLYELPPLTELFLF